MTALMIVDSSFAPATIPDAAQRWALALDEALHQGIEVLTTADGARFTTSAGRLDLLHRVTPTTCDCEAGRSGNPICAHRAALRSVMGVLPVVVLHVDELAPALQA